MLVVQVAGQSRILTRIRRLHLMPIYRSIKLKPKVTSLLLSPQRRATRQRLCSLLSALALSTYLRRLIGCYVLDS